MGVDETGPPIYWTGWLLDWWGQPLHYWTDGTHYRITSCGYDGKPGGVGLDYDLTSEDLPTYQASKERHKRARLPQDTRPTFAQFLSDRRQPHRAGSGRMMALISVLAGIVTFFLAFWTIGRGSPP